MAEALCSQPLPKGNRVAVISSQGGFCVTAAEAISSMGMELPEMSADAQRELREHMREFAPPPVNPIDCIARKSNDAFIDIAEIVAKQDYVDALIMRDPSRRFIPGSRITGISSLRQSRRARESVIPASDSG